jgi:hypothetical protein
MDMWLASFRSLDGVSTQQIKQPGESSNGYRPAQIADSNWVTVGSSSASTMHCHSDRFAVAQCE